MRRVVLGHGSGLDGDSAGSRCRFGDRRGGPLGLGFARQKHGREEKGDEDNDRRADEPGLEPFVEGLRAG